MRLPIQSMHAVLIKPLPGDEAPWFRSVIVDFTPKKELVIVLPSESDRVTEDEEGDTKDALHSSGGGAEENGPGAGTSDHASESPYDDDLDTRMEELFQRGTAVEVELSFPDGIRRFTSVVQKVDLSFGGSLRVDWPDEGTRIQRRDYVRVEAAYRAVVRFEDAASGKLEMVVGSTIDLSAGGVRLKLAEPIPDDTRIEIDVDAAGLETRVLRGRVVRSGEIQAKNKKPDVAPDYWVAVEFVGVDEAMRKEMTQLVFDIQRQLMRRSVT